MKLIRFVVFLPILFTLFSCSGEDEKNINDNSNNIIQLTGKQQRDTVFLHFNIPKKTIRAQRTGKLERLVENPEFKKNSLLIQFDDYDAFVELSGEKEALKEDLTNAIDNLPKSLNPVEKKWRDFATKLVPDKIMPAFPTMEYKEEAGFIEEAKIEEKYRAIQKKELTIQNYFQLSKEDGFITKVYAHSDDYVKKNSPLIAYHPKKIRVIAEASFPLTRPIIAQIKTDLLVRLPVDRVIRTKLSPTKITYSLTLNQKLDPKICPKYVIVNQKQNVFHIPKDFVGKDKKVKVIGEEMPYQAYSKNGDYLIYSDASSLKVQRP
ncbi:hypothetical protein [Fluviicola taffensis]|uniref:hypothetical protein n=1 Tax=Fluviicola taffensis TaxID=191579 RepID=UPI003137F9D5